MMMLPLFSGIQTFLPYLLVVWLIPFLVIAVKMMRRPTVVRLEKLPYTRNRALFSPAERSLLGALEQAVGENYRVFGKVRVADIVSVRSTANQSARLYAFNQIRAKYFDFVLCDKKNLLIRCVIELSDGTDGSRQRQERDTFSEDICKSISLPFIQIRAARVYLAIELRKKILGALREDSEAEMADSEQPFSAALATDPRIDDRPWTLDETGILGGKPGEISDSEQFKASSKLRLDVDR
jgi:Protein of unknown function (DUF2726)